MELQKRGDKSGSQKAAAQANEIRNHLEKHRQVGLKEMSQDEPDFDTPTEQMIQTARMNFGIDLNDPQVANYLKALQKEKKDGPLKQHVEEEPGECLFFFFLSNFFFFLTRGNHMKNVDQLSNSYICMNFLMDSFFFFSLFLRTFHCSKN